jgi:hypothetical protein
MGVPKSPTKTISKTTKAKPGSAGVKTVLKKTQWPQRQQLPDLNTVSLEGVSLPTPGETRMVLRTVLAAFEASEAGVARIAGIPKLSLFQKFMQEVGDQGGSDSQAYHPLATFAGKMRIVIQKSKTTAATGGNVEPLDVKTRTTRLQKLRWSSATTQKLQFKRGKIGIFSRVAVPSKKDSKVAVKARVTEVRGDQLHIVTEGSYKTLQLSGGQAFLIDESNLGKAASVPEKGPKDFGFLMPGQTA